MNQGRIWCVVSPNHGLPLFLGSVALMSFTVHYAVLNNSSWVKDFFNGATLTRAASIETETVPNADLARAETPAMIIDVAQAPVIAADGTTPLVVKVKPKDPLANPS